MSWRDDLRPASWRGIDFGVLTAEGRFGRRTVVHEYAYRDAVWVEDLGRGPRRLQLLGFLVGDDVAAQQEAMIEAAEQEGAGELVHPQLGLLRVTLVEFGTSVRHDLGRVVELHMLFIEAGERLFPASGLATGDLLRQAAEVAGGASGDSFLGTLGSTVSGGVEAIRQAQTTLRGWTSTASRLVGGAANAVNSVGALVPGVGNRWSRYLTGARSPLAQLASANSSVAGQLRRLSRAQAAVTQGAQDVQDLAGRL
jgi:prophage DNA circulation protein